MKFETLKKIAFEYDSWHMIINFPHFVAELRDILKIASSYHDSCLWLDDIIERIDSCGFREQFEIPAYLTKSGSVEFIYYDLEIQEFVDEDDPDDVFVHRTIKFRDSFDPDFREYVIESDEGDLLC